MSDAGPPSWATLLAFVAGGLLGTVLYGLHRTTFVGGIAVLLIAVTIPAVVDLYGWRIRLGMAWLALEQRRRTPELLRTAAGADRWLEDHPEASTLVRASALMVAGRDADAQVLIESVTFETANERARAALMLVTLDALREGHLDVAASRDAIASMPPDERRYRELGLAWSIAWVESLSQRPWRRAFAEASREISVREIPRRWLAALATQQLVATVAVAIGLLLLLVIGAR